MLHLIFGSRFDFHKPAKGAKSLQEESRRRSLGVGVELSVDGPASRAMAGTAALSAREDGKLGAAGLGRAGVVFVGTPC